MFVTLFAVIYEQTSGCAYTQTHRHGVAMLSFANSTVHPHVGKDVSYFQTKFCFLTKGRKRSRWLICLNKKLYTACIWLLQLSRSKYINELSELHIEMRRIWTFIKQENASKWSICGLLCWERFPTNDTLNAFKQALYLLNGKFVKAMGKRRGTFLLYVPYCFCIFVLANVIRLLADCGLRTLCS